MKNKYFIKQKLKNISALFLFIVFTICTIKYFFDYHKNIIEYKNNAILSETKTITNENSDYKGTIPKNVTNIENENYLELRKYFLDVEIDKLKKILHIELNNISLDDEKIDTLKEIYAIINRFENDEILDLNDLKITKKLYDKMKNLKFIGDSQVSFMQGKVDSAYFYGIKGADLKLEYEKVDECLTENIHTIVIFNGYNIGSYKNVDDYINDYYKLIDKIHNYNQNIKIYITSLLPATENAILKDIKNGSVSNLKNGPIFDNALKNEFSNNEKAKYIDTSFLVKPSYYQPDGIHFEAPFYKSYIPFVVYYICFDGGID